MKLAKKSRRRPGKDFSGFGNWSRLFGSSETIPTGADKFFNSKKLETENLRLFATNKKGEHFEQSPIDEQQPTH